MDRTDRALLRHLMQDGRMSFAALATKLRLTDNGVRYRIEQLRKEGVIRGFTVRTDPGAMERPLGVIIRVQTLPETEREVTAHLRRIPQLHVIYTVASRTNLIVVGHFRDAKELSDVLNDRFKIAQIRSHEVDIITRVIREEAVAP